MFVTKIDTLFRLEHYVIIIQVHMYNYMQTHIDTMHTYDRHDDITQLKQPEATIINVFCSGLTTMYPTLPRTSNKLVYHIWTIYSIRSSRIIWTFCFVSNLQ